MNPGEVYVSASVTTNKGTVRGLHFQKQPFSEAKLVSVVKGRIFDVVVNLDMSLPLDERVHTFDLEENVSSCLYIPKGFAHGFQALTDDTVVIYALDSRYNEGATGGFSPLSPSVIELWPQQPVNIKPEDLAWPQLN